MTVVDRSSTEPGVNVQEDSLGNPEQESVTNIGAESEELFSGTTVTAIVPELPAVSVSGKLEGEAAVSESEKFGVELEVAETVAAEEVDALCAVSPE